MNHDIKGNTDMEDTDNRWEEFPLIYGQNLPRARYHYCNPEFKTFGGA